MTFLGGIQIFSRTTHLCSQVTRSRMFFFSYPFPPPPSPLLHTTRMYEVIPHVLFLILKRNILFFQWHLNVGGHQLPLKHILPSTVARLTEESFDGITKVPVCSVLIRLLPHSEVCYVHIYKHVYHVFNIFSVEKF